MLHHVQGLLRSESLTCSLRAQVPTRLGLRQRLRRSVRGAVGLDGESYLGTLLQRAVRRALAFHCPAHRRNHPLTGDGVEKGQVDVQIDPDPLVLADTRRVPGSRRCLESRVFPGTSCDEFLDGQRHAARECNLEQLAWSESLLGIREAKPHRRAPGVAAQELM